MCRAAVAVAVLASAPASADPTLTAGASGELVPSVSNRYSGGLPGAPSETASGPVAYGVGALVDVNVASHVSIGFAPRYLLGLDAGTAPNASASQLDLRVRLALHTHAARAWTIYAFAAPGDSTLFLDGRMATTHSALALELGAGAKLHATRSFAITAEVGYQMTQSFGGVSVVGPGDVIDYSDSFLSFSLGFVTTVL